MTFGSLAPGLTFSNVTTRLGPSRPQRPSRRRRSTLPRQRAMRYFKDTQRGNRLLPDARGSLADRNDSSAHRFVVAKCSAELPSPPRVVPTSGCTRNARDSTSWPRESLDDRASAKRGPKDAAMFSRKARLSSRSVRATRASSRAQSLHRFRSCQKPHCRSAEPARPAFGRP
jgi:hypothetical protein